MSGDWMDGIDLAEDWRAEALCAQIDGDRWFPEKGGEVATAKRICNDCPVRECCLDYALRAGEAFGIWGGLTARERRPIARERGIIPPRPPTSTDEACLHGHPWTEDSTAIAVDRRNGRLVRRCRFCTRIRGRKAAA